MFSATKEAFVQFSFKDGIKKVYKRALVKDHLQDLYQLTLVDNYHDRLNVLEKKALTRYFIFLLSRKDYLSQELLSKAKAAGFDENNAFNYIEELREKGFINDEKLNRKKSLSRVKKGYSIRSISQSHLYGDQEAIDEEFKALRKLIIKKKMLLLSQDIKQRAKGYRFFISRGYDITQINQHLKDLEG